jgi:hypothetical protein
MEAALIRGGSKSEASRAKQTREEKEKTNEHSERGDIQEEKGWQVLKKEKKRSEEQTKL